MQRRPTRGMCGTAADTDADAPRTLLLVRWTSWAMAQTTDATTAAAGADGDGAGGNG